MIVIVKLPDFGFAVRIPAQAGEAGTAETVKLGSVHEHAVRKDAPNK